MPVHPKAKHVEAVVPQRQGDGCGCGERSRGWRDFLVLAGLAACQANAQEIAPFRLTSLEGHLSFRGLSDQVDTRQSALAGSDRSRLAQSGLRSELFIMSHSYVYHPKFLSLDLGGGPLLDRQSYEADASNVSASKTLYNLSGRASIFRDKPLNGSVYYDHLNPTVTLAPGLVMQQESTRYGFESSANSILSPIPFRLAYQHQENTGRGSARSVDERSDQWSLNGSLAYGQLGASQIQLQSTRQASRSGSLLLPVQTSTSDTVGLNVSTRLQFGSERQYELNNIISANSRSYQLTQTGPIEQRDQSFLLELRARHDPQLNTFAIYNRSASSQGNLDSSSQSMNFGLNFQPRAESSATLATRLEETDNRLFSIRTQAVEGSIRHEHKMPLGVLQASLGGNFFTREQNAASPVAPVIGERVLLEGLSYKTIAQPHVLLASIVVSNVSRTQVFISGIDYALLQIGTETKIQRLPGGSILDGEEVQIDYAYDTGGTFSYRQLDRTFNLNWSVSRHFNVYLRRFDVSPVLTSGSPAYPLNAVQSSIFGMRGDFPIRLGAAFSVGGNYERENRQETISPYRRQGEELYLQTDESLFDLGNFRLSHRRTQIEYEQLGQNMNLSGYEARYWARPFPGFEVSATMGLERDSALGVPMRRRSDTVNLQWRERKLSLTTQFARTQETRDAYERTHTMLQFLVRRDF